ncbi:MAG: hypothetical protein NTV61_04420 [Candidatus Bathyarchaeota archaeon]|nr:hypothetical protein [Candidatus Bathyarchaeota archaeon]
MSEQQGPQNFIQFLFMVVKAYIVGLPKMIKSLILSAVISGLITLGLHFYLLLYPNDGYNTSGDPVLDAILVLADKQPPGPNVFVFWFLLNFLFWYVIGVFNEKGIVGGLKQFATTPVFVVQSLAQAGLGAFPLLMAGVAFAFILRLFVLIPMTSLQMFLMMVTILVSQSDSIPLLGLKLGINDLKGFSGRKMDPAEAKIAEPASLVIGALLGFGYLVFFPFDILMVQILLGLMVVGLIVVFMRGRGGNKKMTTLAMVLMLVCIFALATQPVRADDGGAAESGGAGNVLANASLRDFMIKQGIAPALAGIAAALAAQGKLTPGLFDQLKKGKLGPRPGETIDEMQTRHKVEKQILTNLQHIQKEIWFGKGQKLWKGEGEPGNVDKQIDKVINDLLSGKGLDLDKYNKIYTVYTGHVTGRTITEDMIPTSNELNKEILQNTIAWTTKEIVTGVDVDGNFSWSSMGLRIILGGVTMGGSEYVYVPANSIYSMKNYVDKGGNSILGGFWAAGKEAVWQWGIGRAIGAGFGIAGKGAGMAGKYLANKFPNAANAASNLVNKISKILNTKITWPGSGPKVPGKVPGTTISGPKGGNVGSKINSQVARAPTVPKAPSTPKSPYPGVKNPSFTKAGKPPDLRGMTPKDQKALKFVAEKHGVAPQMRPTTKYAAKHIEKGTAKPKPESIKNKTINDTDAEHLGFPKGDNKGLVACKSPNPLPKTKPADMTNQEWRDVKKRWVQREREFRDNKDHLTQMENEGKIEWDKDTGIIYGKNPNGTRGKPYTGDNDAFGFVDPVTGKPVSPTVNNAINQDLQKLGVTQHNEHLGWDYSHSSKTPAAPGAQSEFGMKQGIDNKIMNGHAPGGEPLNTYNPLEAAKNPGDPQAGWSTSYWTGGVRQ